MMGTMAPPHSTPRYDEPDWELGKLIRQAREGIGLSLRQASEHAGVSIAAFNTVETGRRSIGRGQHVPARNRPTTIASVASAVGLDADYAVRMAGFDPTRVLPGRGGPPSVTERELSTMFSKLSTDQRSSVLQLIRSMLAKPDDDGEQVGTRSGALTEPYVAEPDPDLRASAAGHR